MSKFTDSCAPTNPLQNLSSGYGQSNSKARSGVEGQIDRLLPGASAGDVVGFLNVCIKKFICYSWHKNSLHKKPDKQRHPQLLICTHW